MKQIKEEQSKKAAAKAAKMKNKPSYSLITEDSIQVSEPDLEIKNTALRTTDHNGNILIVKRR